MGSAEPITDFSNDSFLDELNPGTRLLQGQYTIKKFLNSGGFGITYLACDSLDRTVVIKECFPSSVCHRSRAIVHARSRAQSLELGAVVQLFVKEARRLAKLNHPNIVGVHQVFEENQTAYMVLDFVEGRDLLDTIEDPNHGLTPPQIKKILREVLGAVAFIHSQDILHRDISPDNILIGSDLRPVLIDFGAAREEATKKSRALSAMRVVKDGYSPQEFYIQGSEQTPSSDLYALAATFYHLIEGTLPPNSQSRLAAVAMREPDPYRSLVGRVGGYDANFLGAIDTALGVLPKDRMQSAAEWLTFMETGQREARVTVPPAPARMAERVAFSPDTPRRKKPFLALVSVAALVVLGGLVMSGKMPTLTLGTAQSSVAPPLAPVTTAVVTPPVVTPTETIAVATPAPFAFTLGNGDSFQAVEQNGVWKTTVTAVAAASSEMKVGDQVIALLPRNEKLTGRSSMQTMVQRDTAGGGKPMRFAVSRDGALLIATLAPDAGSSTPTPEPNRKAMP